MRQEKTLLLEQFQDQVKESNAVIVTQINGVTALSSNDLRRKLREKGAEFEVVKKRVFNMAAKNQGLELQGDMLDGQVAVVFANQDALEATKEVFNFCKENKDRMKVLGGQVDGQVYGAEDMRALSELPSKDEMRAQLLSVLQAPAANLVGIINAVLTVVPNCLDAKIKTEQ